MTETLRPDPDEELFRELKIIHMDPILTAVFDEMRVCIEYFRTAPQTSTEINRIMSELDTKWRIAMHRKGKFTGIARFPDPAQPDAPLVETFYEDQPIIFRGVFPEEIGEGTIATYDTEETNFYDLRIQLSRLSKDQEGNEFEYVGSAALDAVEKLDIDGLMSIDRAKLTLLHFQPELYATLERSLTEEAEHECEIALRLKDLAYDSEGQDVETRDQTLLALDTYTNHLLKFDGLYGYVLGSDGMGWLLDEDGVPEQCKMEVLALAKVHAVDWRLAANYDDDRFLPHVIVHFGRPKLGDQTRTSLVPLSGIHTLQSQRHTFYNDQTE